MSSLCYFFVISIIRCRCWSSVIHVDDAVDPIRDLETIQSELCAKDKEALEKVLEREKDRVRKEKSLSRASEVPLSETFQEAYDKCKQLIDENTPVQTYEDFSAAEVDMIRDWGLSMYCVVTCISIGYIEDVFGTNAACTVVLHVNNYAQSLQSQLSTSSTCPRKISFGRDPSGCRRSTRG